MSIPWSSTNGPLCYLATPYTKYQGGDMGAAFVDASKLAAKLLHSGVKVYSPIAHCHPIAVNGGPPPGDHEFWLPFDEAMMTAAHVLIVAHMDGWDRSKGIAHEIAFFERAGKPIYDLDPGTMLMKRREDVRERSLA